MEEEKPVASEVAEVAEIVADTDVAESANMDEEVEGEDENEEVSKESVLIGAEDFDTADFKIPKGPFMPQSALNLEGLTEEEVMKVLTQFSDYELEDLLNKNTESFRCLAQMLISHSSLMRHILYPFPELEDPGIDEAFNYVEPEITFDDIGASKYKQLCKDMNIPALSRVVNSLNSEALNLKYYGLSEKQFKAICNSIMLNTHVKTLILEDNWISPTAALWLCEVLRENNSIQMLNLRECRLGVEGITHCVDGFALNQSVREIDLSFNDLGDEGIEILVGALKDNYNVDKLNLGHNNLGEQSGKCLGELLLEHSNIDYLDLSWNDFYMGKALAYLCKGIAESDGLECLILSWNGIGSPETVGPIAKYLKKTEKLQHLDLSFNRIMGPGVGMLTAAMKENNSLISLNLGFNLVTPDDAIKLTSALKADKPMNYLDLQNIYVNKDFIPIWNKVTNMGKSVRVEGILKNYTIVGPNRSKVVFDRCRYLAQKPKKKKLKKDFGTYFIWNLPDEVVDVAALKKLVKKSKIKLDSDLVEFLGDTFSPKKKKIELKLMRDTYLEMYPETAPPPPPMKKGKKGKKAKKGQKKEQENEERPSTEDKGIITESFQTRGSSLVALAAISKAALQTLSTLRQRESQYDETNEPEMFVSKTNLTAARSSAQPKRSVASAQDVIKDGKPPTASRGKSIAFRDSVEIK